MEPALGDELPLIIAHRGASHAAPENTLAAFRLGWQEGADGIEGDFYLTTDGSIVCIHDRDTRRTAGENLEVSQSTKEQLRQLDVGQWKGAQFAGQRIPDLREVLATIPFAQDSGDAPGASGKIFIEVKCGPEIVPVLKKVLAESAVQAEQVSVISFNEDVISGVKREIPQVTANWLTDFKQQEDGTWKPSPAEIVSKLQRLKADGVGVGARRPALTLELAEALRKGGFGFHVWTVDDAQLARHLIQLGVHSLTTNRPAELRRELLQDKQP